MRINKIYVVLITALQLPFVIFSQNHTLDFSADRIGVYSGAAGSKCIQVGLYFTFSSNTDTVFYVEQITSKLTYSASSPNILGGVPVLQLNPLNTAASPGLSSPPTSIPLSCSANNIINPITLNNFNDIDFPAGTGVSPLEIKNVNASFQTITLSQVATDTFLVARNEVKTLFAIVQFPIVSNPDTGYIHLDFITSPNENLIQNVSQTLLADTTTIIHGSVRLTDSLIDGGVSALANPTSGSPVNTTDSIRVWIKNYGSLNIQNFNVSYAVDGGTPVTEFFSGSIFSGDSALHTFSTPWTPATGGSYEICAYADINGDPTEANDTSCTSVASTLAIDEQNGKEELIRKIYPSPANNHITFELNPAFQYSRQNTLQLYTMYGALIREIRLNDSSGQTIRVHTGDLHSGKYMYRINTGSTQQTGTILIVH